MFGEKFLIGQVRWCWCWGSVNPASRWRAGARGTGAGCAIADTRADAAEPLASWPSHGIDAEFVGGAFTPALLDGGIEIVAISPGLSPLADDLKPLIDAARERGIPVWGELELFAQALKSLGANGYAPKVLAITGTNGKTTTTALTGLLCERAGKTVAVAGNISPAMLDKLSRSNRQHRAARCLGAGAVELPAGNGALASRPMRPPC